MQECVFMCIIYSYIRYIHYAIRLPAILTSSNLSNFMDIHVIPVIPVIPVTPVISVQRQGLSCRWS